ncbi:MAG: HAMP domain-containing histidine kinase [Anaerolineae bacterium]|nr:HAMP domain-containing histidine kinase [Phycisphaerae bacterium]
MFKRLRQLHISLAAKCQILFGTAVAAIIFAALFVPWQRIEQLTEQLNEKAAGAVADAVIGEHISRQTALLDASSTTTAPSRIQIRATSQPTSAPSVAFAQDGQNFPAPRLVGVAALNDPSTLSRFELAALSRFVRDPNSRVERRYNSTKEEFRYAATLYSSDRCVVCHDGSQPAMATNSLASAPGASNAALPTAPSTQPSPALIGMISVDLPSQIKAREILLNRLFLLLAGLIAGSLAIIIFYLITTRLILQPVRVLQETAEKVSKGDLNIRSDINTGDEFQQLSETFNVMLINLKRSADQLRAVNKSLDLKLGQLAESNVALYESNRLKSEFLANVSHELRTPLNSILGFAELLKDNAAGAVEPKSVRYLQNILSSGHHLLDLINDLLDLAKIEAGKMDVRSEPLPLADLFEGLTSVLKPMTESKQLTIVPSIAADIPILQTDSAKLQQVLYNFLSNAIKFSPPGARIDLTAERSDGKSVRLTVTDRGPGIAADKHGLIFEKFRQLDGSHTREHSGTGLGLAISKELATLLGGTVGLRSAAGEGATFWITIPLAIESGAQDVRAKLVLT